MIKVLIALIFIILAAIIPKLIPKMTLGWVKPVLQVVAGFIGLIFLLSTSYVTIDADKVGHLKRIYLGKSMPPGQIIAFDGYNGPQARVLAPGFHFKLLLNVLNTVEQLPVVNIPAGKYGYIVAKDGAPLKKGQFLASAWPEGKLKEMLGAEYFLKNNGQKGPQYTVIRPGKYRLNRYLFDVTTESATNIPAGFVGVIKSNVQETEKFELAPVARELAGSLSVPLVKRGSIGVWVDPLPPGKYYLNLEAYNITMLDTRVQTWNYKGGYTRRYIDLRVTQDGKIVQTERSEYVPVPANAADKAILTRMEGWLVPQEIRVQVQVEPKDAPFLVASVGTLEAAEDKIVTPSIRSVVRNISAAEKVLSLINENRARVEKRIEDAVIPEGKKAGVTIKDVRLVDSVVPPELMVARLREQLAIQLQETFKREKDAQDQRIQTEKARATADQQGELVAAEIRVKIAEKDKQASQLRGEGEKLLLTEVAAGQKAQVAVLGEDRVMQLAILDKVLQAAVKNPLIVKVPQVYVSGVTGGLEGAAAILGASNLVDSIAGQAWQKKN